MAGASSGPTPTLAEALARATDTHQVLVSRGALHAVPDIVRDLFGSRAAVVVADATTYDVAGREVERRLRGAGLAVAPAYVFPASGEHGGALHANYAHAARLGEVLTQLPANLVPVAVGAGTVNDLVKLGAHFAGRLYLVVATAASVDGYAAFGAAITRDGYKQTIACPAPRAVVADVDVLAAAPAAMTASGFGDLLGKITAGADWLVADAMGVEAVDAAAWQMVQPATRQVVVQRGTEAERLRQGAPEAVEQLFLALTMSGLAMQAAQSSRPASGAEHQMSHLWEMRGLRATQGEPSHGFKVAVGTATMAALYERLLALDLDALDVGAQVSAWPSWDAVEADVRRTHPDPQLAQQAVGESRAKYLTGDELGTRLRRLRERWPALRDRLQAQLLPAAEVRRLLRAAGCPSGPAEIGLAPGALPASVLAARQIRRRYTALDLGAEAGVLESLLVSLDEGRSDCG
jgi:glycerol-1-phosphate dehydrogenase [NAD(P)+]